MGKKVIIPRTANQNTHKAFKPSNGDHKRKSISNDSDNNSLRKVLPPKVYIIHNSSFKSVVQQLTGNVSIAPSSPPPLETSPEIVPSFSDLYFRHEFCGVSEGTPSNSNSYSSMKDFGYSLTSDNAQIASPESLSSLDCTFSRDQEVYNPSNQLFSFEDLESWILDMSVPEPEVSIYDYELSGLL